MGKLITFWSPYSGHGMVTSSLCAVAGGLALQYPACRIAISHTETDDLSLAEKLDAREKSNRKVALYENLGIHALKMYIRKMELTDEIIEKCGVPLPMKSIFFYPNISTSGSDKRLLFQILTQQLKHSYDIVFLDLASENRDEAVLFMKEADLAIVMLSQEPAYVEQFIREGLAYLEQIKYGFIFGGSLSASKYNCKFYKKKMKIGNRILGEICKNTGFFDAMCEGKTLEFFLRNQMVVKNEENYEFICQAKKTAECVGQKINLI